MNILPTHLFGDSCVRVLSSDYSLVRLFILRIERIILKYEICLIQTTLCSSKLMNVMFLPMCSR